MAAWSPAQAIIIMNIDMCKDNAFEQQPSEAWSPELVTGKGGWEDFVSSSPGKEFISSNIKMLSSLPDERSKELSSGGASDLSVYLSTE